MQSRFTAIFIPLSGGAGSDESAENIDLNGAIVTTNDEQPKAGG